MFIAPGKQYYPHNIFVYTITLSIWDRAKQTMYLFVCIEGFMAQSTQWGRVKRGQFT